MIAIAAASPWQSFAYAPTSIVIGGIATPCRTSPLTKGNRCPERPASACRPTRKPAAHPGGRRICPTAVGWRCVVRGSACVNEEPRQNSRTADMVYDARLVEDLAGVMTLSRATWSPRAPRRARLLAARRPPTCGPATWCPRRSKVSARPWRHRSRRECSGDVSVVTELAGLELRTGTWSACRPTGAGRRTRRVPRRSRRVSPPARSGARGP
jgi:hypothetical protein